MTTYSYYYIVLFLVLLFLCINTYFWLKQQKQNTTQESTELLLLMKDLQQTLSEKFYQGQVENLQTLSQMSQHLRQQLQDGLEKNTNTSMDIVKRLTIIDEAQKKMGELSSHIVNLEAILSNKGARGAFGEVQLSALIQNMIPPSHYALQHTLKNGKRADCLLFLPKPTGNIVIDAKFPLENYQRLLACHHETEKVKLSQQFRQDIKKHIKDIMDKYIIADETAAGAMMFIPAEAIFAEIHANYPDLVQYSHDCSIWLVSPTTLMAILTTARAVLKDDATRQQVHVIQEHLKQLADDFKRSDKRMQNLTRYIQQANDEANDVNISAKKITHRFEKIEQVDLNVTLTEDNK